MAAGELGIANCRCPKCPIARGGTNAQLDAESATGDAVGSDGGSTVKEEPPADEPGRSLDLSSPRAAMRTFLVALQEAAGDHPQRIDDAVQCLDTSQLEEDGRLERARQLARRLHTIIDKKGIRLDDLPEHADGLPYSYFKAEVAEGATTAPEIALARDDGTGLWLFTADTLRSIPALEQSILAQAEPAKATESTVPVSRRSPRATMATFLEAMNADPWDMRAAVLCLDPANQDREAWNTRSRELATQLKSVMDKIKLVVLSEISGAPDGTPHVWYTSETGNIVIGRIEEQPDLKDDWQYTPQLGEWRFTPKTLKTLNALYAQLETREIIPELHQAGVREELTLSLRLQR